MTVRLAMFVPCRAGSERLPDKNIRPFAGRNDGLLGVKLDQLELVDAIDLVVVDSNDPRVLEIASARRERWRARSELLVRERPDALGRSDTTTDALIAYALETVACEELAWTHVTSPLIDARLYSQAIETFQGRDRCRYDSLMLVTRWQTFLWREEAGHSTPLYERRGTLRWPRTQDLEPVFEVNSGLFIVPRAIGLMRGDRIGASPQLFEVERSRGLDIDHADEFRLAELLFAELANR
jgi:CMP-N-acetylneuraminic acid synthetase